MSTLWEGLLRRLLSLVPVLFIAAGVSHAAADDRSACDKTTGDEAIAACTRLITSGKVTGGDLAITFFNRGTYFSVKREYDRSIADFSETIRLNPNYAQAFVGRGNVYNGKREYDRAIADLNEAIRLDPKIAGAYALRSVSFRWRYNYDRAIEDANEAIRLAPNSAPGFVSRALAYLGKHNYDGAIEDANEAIRLAPNAAHHFGLRGHAYGKKGDFDRAMPDLNKALQINPQYASAYSYRGLFYGKKGDFDRAMPDLNKAIQIEKFPTSYSNRGLIHEAKGDLKLALTDFRAALALDPRQEDAVPGAKRVQQKLAASEHEKTGPPKAGPPVAATPPASSQLATVHPATPPVLAVPAEPGRRVALVIGNSGYQAVAALPNPRRDAETVAVGLRAVGFQSVTLEHDLNREKLLNALRSFAREAETADWAVVYFAGHGIEIGGVNYLIPIDAKLESDGDVQFEAIPLDHVLGAAERAKRLRLVLLDACRDNPFARQMRRSVAARSIGRGLAQVEPEAGTLVVYAAKHGQVALDGDGANSPFASALISRMRTPQLDVRRMFDLVRDDVMAATSKRQQPFSYGSVSGSEDFFFVTR